MKKFDQKFTDQLAAWINDENRDYTVGAMYLLKLRGNHMEYDKIMRNLMHFRDYLMREIKKFYTFRSTGKTHEEVTTLVNKAESVANTAKTETETGVRSGKRIDHDSLPEEIKQCYVDNLDLMRRISDYHTKIRLIIQSSATCKDVDLLPFATEIIALDKQRLANWEKYDKYKAEENEA